jgi:hypothetical protein
MLNRDFRELLSAFSDAGVEYLLVGAYALAAPGLVYVAKVDAGLEARDARGD